MRRRPFPARFPERARRARRGTMPAMAPKPATWIVRGGQLRDFGGTGGEMTRMLVVEVLALRDFARPHHEGLVDRRPRRPPRG